MTHSYVKESSIIRHDLWVIYLTHNFYWPRWLYNVTECCNNKSAKNSILKILYYVMHLRHNNFVIHHARVANHVIVAYSSYTSQYMSWFNQLICAINLLHVAIRTFACIKIKPLIFISYKSWFWRYRGLTLKDPTSIQITGPVVCYWQSTISSPFSPIYPLRIHVILSAYVVKQVWFSLLCTFLVVVSIWSW